MDIIACRVQETNPTSQSPFANIESLSQKPTNPILQWIHIVSSKLYRNPSEQAVFSYVR